MTNLFINFNVMEKLFLIFAFVEFFIIAIINIHNTWVKNKKSKFVLFL